MRYLASTLALSLVLAFGCGGGDDGGGSTVGSGGGTSGGGSGGTATGGVGGGSGGSQPDGGAGSPTGGSGGCGCATTQTCCDNTCVSKGDPAYGCGSCTPCQVPHAFAACVSGACAVGTCDSGFADCDGDAANGCEAAPQLDPNNCGTCGNACGTVDHAATACVAGSCALTCDFGFADCDGVASNGCEAELAADDDHCGSCSNACAASVANGSTSCQAGQCVIACAAGYDNCDGNDGNGCEVTLATDVSHCGSCATPCSTVNGAPTCSGGQCSIQCSAGFDDCDNNVGTGCETNLNTTVAHCGACKSACSATNASPSCGGGQCSFTCFSGYTNCNGSPGCEVHTSVDMNNCGGCGVVCNPTPAYGTGACQNGSCKVTCDSGFADCDSNLSNGCETNVATNDPKNCGGCGVDCGTSACVANLCQPVLLASGTAGSMPQGIVTDATHVYWAEWQGGRVARVSKQGGAVITVGTGNSPYDVAVDDTYVYYTLYVGYVYRANKTGGGTVQLTKGPGIWFRGIDIDATDIYFIGNDDKSVMRMSKSGANKTAIVSGIVNGEDLVVDGSYVYYTEHYVSGGLFRVNKAGGSASKLGSADIAQGVAVDQTHAFWAIEGAGAVGRVNKGGGGATTIASSQAQPMGVASDGINVYWVNRNDNTVMRCAVGGCSTPQTLATGQSYPWGITIDDTSIYWTNRSNGTIMKMVVK